MVLYWWRSKCTNSEQTTDFNLVHVCPMSTQCLEWFRWNQCLHNSQPSVIENEWLKHCKAFHMLLAFVSYDHQMYVEAKAIIRWTCHLQYGNQCFRSLSTSTALGKRDLSIWSVQRMREESRHSTKWVGSYCHNPKFSFLFEKHPLYFQLIVCKY